MADQTPSAVLLAAADLIRDLAAATAPGQWTLIRREDKYGNHVHSHFTLPPLPGATVERARQVRPSDAVDYAWIVALSPALAPMIEKWLRETASYFDEFGDYWVSVPEQAQNALDCARAVLGSGVNTQ